MAATPTIIWVETRIPVRITGHAIGNSTLSRIRQRDNPIPCADSITLAGTERRPTIALPITGSAAKNASMMNDGTTPRPNGTISRASSASEGIVNATRLDVSVSAEPSGRRYTSTATTIATNVPTRTVWNARDAC